MKSYVVFLGLVCLPTLASADQFTITVQSLDVSSATVRVAPPTPSYGPCPLLPCVRATCYGTVSPCPPGRICNGGSSPFTIFTSELMTLEYGVSYTFTGYWEAERGDRVNNTCTFSCLHVDPIETTSFDVGEAAEGTWVVTPVEVSGANTWVEVDNQPDSPGACTGSCPHISVNMTIAPWPIEAQVFVNGQWFEQTLIRSPAGYATIGTGFPGLGTLPLFRLLLAPGNYVIAGETFTMFRRRDNAGDPCGEDHCSMTGLYGPTSFNPATLAVVPTTWGRVKALYRN